MFHKKMRKTFLWLFAAGIIILFLTCFCNFPQPQKQPFVVERQECVPASSKMRPTAVVVATVALEDISDNIIVKDNKLIIK